MGPSAKGLSAGCGGSCAPPLFLIEWGMRILRGLRLGISKEEKVAKAIGHLLSDFSLILQCDNKWAGNSEVGAPTGS